MDRQTAQTLIENTFNYPFNEERFRYFTINLLNDVDEGKAFPYLHGQYIKDSFKHHIKKYKRIGTYTDPDSNKVDVLVVHLTNPWALERSRTMLRNFAAWYLKNRDEKDAALIGYYTDDPDDWRFSFIKMEYRQAVTETGRIKVKEELTSARRYSFLVGKNEPNHTAQAQLIPILEDDQKNPSLSDIEDAFSVDAVAKQFYKDYRTLFEKLTDELNVILKKDAKIKREFEDKTIDTANFAKKLMGQIVFLYFLQKKGWLGVGRDEKGDYRLWGAGPKNFLRRLFNKEYTDYQNFFNDVLEPFFYEALATERPNDSYSRFNCKIPFLNGGLFEPINDYNWDETDILIDNAIFSEILGIFDRYNFTVKEDDPLDKEVAVDPEMLGKVFENLLPENLRKGKGAYYTPRTIVHYMCQESLIYYLANECEGTVPKKDIETFIRKGESTVEFEVAKEEGTKSYIHQIPDSIRNNAKLLDEKLTGIKICDPAIGSGAFPVGMMNEIVKARTILDIYLKKNLTVYDVKRHCIQHSLYGVDIDPGAIDIAKLRLWLSLVVDEEDYHTIKPLPNLDFKIMQGNSLIEEFHGISLDIEKKKGQIELGLDVNTTKLDRLIEKLHQMQTAFFNAVHPSEKQKLKQDVEQVILKIFLLQLEQKKKYDPKKGKAIENELCEMTHGNKMRSFFPWKLYFADVFREKGGFDVVIANPPYVSQETIKDSNFLKKFATYNSRADLYTYFIERGLDIIARSKILVYITSNRFTRTNYGKNLRSHLANKNIKVVINFHNMQVFENANVDPLIIIISNEDTNNEEVAICNYSDSDRSTLSFYQEINSKIFFVNKTHFKGMPWSFKENKMLDLKEKILSIGTPLNAIPGIKLNRGFSTGCNMAFVIDDMTKNEICKKDQRSSEIIKPVLKGRNIRRYYTTWDNLWIILSKYGFHKKIKNYPGVYGHLEFFKELLQSRGQCRYTRASQDNDNKGYPGQHHYLELDNNPKDFFLERFRDEKIFWTRLSNENRFAISYKEEYSLDSTGILTTSDNRYYCAILNSKLLLFYFKLIGVIWGKDGIKWFGKGFDKLPVYVIDQYNSKDVKIRNAIVDAVDKIHFVKKKNLQADIRDLEEEIDSMVYELYGLTEEEISIVEESVG